MRVHLFDVDHTLMRSSTGLCFMRTGVAAGCFSILDLLKIPGYMMQYKRGKLDLDSVTAELPLFRGFREDRLVELGRESFQKHVRQRLYQEAVQLIQGIKADGGRVILATSSFDFLIAPIMEHLGVSEAVCSRLEFREGTCTGAIAGPLSFGHSKSEQVMKYLDVQHISLQECTAYSDSAYDLPLLSAVQTAVAVNPDGNLAAHAKRSGWRILRWKTLLDRKKHATISTRA